MSETALFSVLIFAATVLLVLSLWSYFGNPFGAQKKINRRLRALKSGASSVETLELLRRERWLFGDRYGESLGSLRRYLVQSGVRLDPKELGLTALVITGAAMLLFVTLGLSIPLALAASLALALTLMAAFFQQARRKRIARFREQLPDVLELIVRSLRAGHPLSVSFGLVAREMPDPAGTEFGILADEIQFGATIPAAVANLSYRVGDPDLDYVTTCISIQGQTGGNLAEVLSRLAGLIRSRFQLFRKVRALTSEARISAIVLSLLPVILFLLINVISPDYYAEVWHEPSFQKALMTSAGLLLVGNLIMRRLANIRF